MTPRRARWTHVLFYYAPLALYLAFALYLATSHGDYNTSLADLYGLLAFLGPEYPRTDIESMYGINGVARRVAYLVQYGMITILLVRALQSGAPRLRRRSIGAVIGIGIVFIGLDNAVRNRTPGRHGGWDDMLLSLIAVLLTTSLVCCYFTLKKWEHQTLSDSPKNMPSE